MAEGRNRSETGSIASMFGNPRPDWLALHSEAAIEPSLPIVDSHHHLWQLEGNRYLLQDFADDLAGGHNVTASVYVECGSRYREGGPDALRPLGEVEFAAKVFAEAAGHGKTAVCSAIVGTADLSLGGKVREVLEGAIDVGRGHLRGIRRITAWDADEELMANLIRRRPAMLAEPSFREGFACLAPLGLVRCICFPTPTARTSRPRPQLSRHHDRYRSLWRSHRRCLLRTRVAGEFSGMAQWHKCLVVLR